uniref:Adhesion G protein-coupled receptor E1 n=1 Tax=Terrapene triunguis TaxID=2587831 RepID=A0A674JAD5_9SAUR
MHRLKSAPPSGRNGSSCNTALATKRLVCLAQGSATFQKWCAESSFIHSDLRFRVPVIHFHVFRRSLSISHTGSQWQSQGFLRFNLIPRLLVRTASVSLPVKCFPGVPDPLPWYHVFSNLRYSLLFPYFYFIFLQPSNSRDELFCVSWEATARRGSWSQAGCGVLRSNASHTTCSCNRVSNLAVLMASGEITADFPLFLISHVGLALSVLCLFLAILTFLLCRSIRNVNTSIHLQLCLCLFLADLLFLTAVDRPSHQLACAVIAGILHYLFLACFAWMFLEAVVLFLTVRNLGVVNYFSTHSPKMGHLSLFGYGFPALVVAVSAAVMPEGYGRRENCWLSMEKGFIWSFLGPVCVIIGINSVLFALTLWMLQRKLSSLNTEVSTLKDTRLLTFKAIAQVFILGCTWIFGLLQVGPAATVMAYLFTVVNSLQGAFIFLVHCLLNRQVPPRALRPLMDLADPLPAESRAG